MEFSLRWFSHFIMCERQIPGASIFFSEYFSCLSKFFSAIKKSLHSTTESTFATYKLQANTANECNECVTYFADMVISLGFRGKLSLSGCRELRSLSGHIMRHFEHNRRNVHLSKRILQSQWIQKKEKNTKRERKVASWSHDLFHTSNYTFSWVCLETKLNTNKSRAFKAFEVKCECTQSVKRKHIKTSTFAENQFRLFVRGFCFFTFKKEKNKNKRNNRCMYLSFKYTAPCRHMPIPNIRKERKNEIDTDTHREKTAHRNEQYRMSYPLFSYHSLLSVCWPAIIAA